jgi:hypothetical protein
MPVSDSSTSLLLKAATPELYRRNAFRLTGLPVTATAREVSRQADKLKMLADLGGQAAQQLAVIPGMGPPTTEEIRGATQRLKDVEARALDEFFWFWPEDWEKPEADEAFTSLKRNDLDNAYSIWAKREVETQSFIASRNIALVLHMRSIEWALLDFTHPLPQDRIEKVHGYWKDSFDRWEWLADDDRLWDAFKVRIRQINDPALTTGFARRIRTELPQAFDKINAELALTYAQRGRRAEAQWHVDFLKSTHSGQDDVSATLDTVLAPSRERLERAIESARQATKADKSSGTTHARKLLDAAEPLLAVFDMIHETDSLERCQLFDEVAQAVLGCAIDGYNICNQALQNQPPPSVHATDHRKVVNEAFLKVLHRAEALATDLDLRQRISQNINTAQGNLQFDTKVKPLLDTLTAIQRLTTTSPEARLAKIKSEVIPKVNGLFQPSVLDDQTRINLGNSLAIVLRGIALAANNDFHQPRVGMEALTIAVRFARDPELLVRLKQDAQTMTQNMAAAVQHPASTNSSKGCLWTFIAGFALLILNGMFSGGSKSSTNSYPSTYRPPATKPKPSFQYSPPPKVTYQPPEPIRLPEISSYTAPPLSTQSVAQPALDPKGWHIWKNRAMKELTAKMLSFDGSNVILETQDGKTYTYPLDGLSDQSQQLAHQLSDLSISKYNTPADPIPKLLPTTGIFRGPSFIATNTGPLTIRTRAGSGNFYVKLVERTNLTTPMIIFVQDGATAHDISVPAGTYEMRYASGETWYGEDSLFGPNTSYSKADDDFTFGNGDGYTVELYKQANGNLPTSSINKNNF